MADLRVCFYNKGTPLKRGTILRHVADALQRRGVLCTYGDEELEPDVYIFEKVWHETRYQKPVIIHAENLIGERAKNTHCYDRGNAIVFNSEWLRQVYYNTYGTELDNVWVIPPGHQMDTSITRHPMDVSEEQHIVCISKWWKRPYKRFPLIARAFDYLNRELGYPNAKLHVHGWFLDRPMPYLDTWPRLWKLPQNVRDNPNILYYQKSFHNDTYRRLMAIAHIVVHVSAIDSGPQVVVEAVSQGVPVVITNNMGAAEWVRDIGPKSGIVLEFDAVTTSYSDIRRLVPQYERLLHRVRSPLSYYRFYKLCSDTRAYRQVAYAMKEILDNYSSFHFEPPRKYTMDGIADQWLEAIQSVIR